MIPTSAIQARRAPRYEIVLPVRVSVAPEHVGRVRLRAVATELSGDLIDIGRGGVAFMLPCFLPRMCLATLRILGLEGSRGPTLLTGRVRVQRVMMTDCRPAYLVGGLFVQQDAIFMGDLDALLRRLGAGQSEPRGDAA